MGGGQSWGSNSGVCEVRAWALHMDYPPSQVWQGCLPRLLDGWVSRGLEVLSGPWGPAFSHHYQPELPHESQVGRSHRPQEGGGDVFPYFTEEETKA